MTENDQPQKPTATTAIRALLFLKARMWNEHLLKCLADVASHLEAEDELAVIGALTDFEENLGHLRALMLLCRDGFPQIEKGEN